MAHHSQTFRLRVQQGEETGPGPRSAAIGRDWKRPARHLAQRREEPDGGKLTVKSGAYSVLVSVVVYEKEKVRNLSHAGQLVH